MGNHLVIVGLVTAGLAEDILGEDVAKVEELTASQPTEQRRSERGAFAYNFGIGSSTVDLGRILFEEKPPNMVERLQNLVNFIGQWLDTPHADTMLSMLNIPMFRESVMNGRRRVEADAEDTDSDRRRVSRQDFWYEGGPSLMDRTQNLANFLDMWKDNPQFEEIWSLVMGNSMLRESIMEGGRRLVEADAELEGVVEAEFRRMGFADYENHNLAPDDSPNLAERTQNLANFMKMWKDHPEFAEIMSLVWSNSFFRESVMNGRRLETEEHVAEEASQSDRRRVRVEWDVDNKLGMRSDGPGIVEQVQNLLNFYNAWKDSPNFEEMWSLVMGNSMLRQAVMNGRRRAEADAEATDAGLLEDVVMTEMEAAQEGEEQRRLARGNKRGRPSPRRLQIAERMVTRA